MRFDGTLTAWNAKKADGVITPLSGAADVYVQASAFGTRSTYPAVGERVSYELRVSKSGKPFAVNVVWADQMIAEPITTKRTHAGASGSPLKSVLFVIALVLIGYFAFPYAKGTLNRLWLGAQSPTGNTKPLFQTESRSRYACDGRTTCPQMRSCEEATWFINNCPGTKMDGDADGVPCESQWCDAPLR